jgi:stage II sporulation protein E
MLDDYEKKGWIEAENPECINKSGFYNIAARLFELHSNNLSWNNKIMESRELVSQQLLGVSSVIGTLAGELDIDLRFDEALEESIVMELTKLGVEVDSVIVLENNQGKYEVSIKHKSCMGRKKCLNDIIPAVNSVLMRRMHADDGSCAQKKGTCQLRLLEEKKYRMTSGVSRLTRAGLGESGDSYSFMELRNGKCLLALSDGMGSGARAREESAATVELLEDFIESGFEKELAVKIINSVLVLRSTDELFSTLDICSVDLYTGEAEFIKIGASSTFLLRDGRVSIIKSASLPMGMLRDVDVEVSVKKLKNNDIIIMVTDGILETGDTYEDREQWVVDTLLGSAYMNPQDMADYLISSAEGRGGAADDMTVLVARVWEKK